MQLTDIEVIKKANAWLSQNKACWLCTILHTYGSAPRPIGSLFLTDGIQRTGSISGGCLEDAFVEMLNKSYFKNSCQTFIYGKHTEDENIVRELPCGGTITLLIEHLKPTKSTIEHIKQWLELAVNKKPLTRHTDLHSQNKEISNIVEDHQPAIIQNEDKIQLTYFHVYSLLLIGIGQVTEQIARLGLLAGFDVKVCDMRRELAESWNFDKENSGVDITWMSPDLFVEKYANRHSAVLALAHDPRIDDVALMSVFDTAAFYIGAMGSNKTSIARIQRLKDICEITNQQLTRLHAPIGLNIGSKTPVEIAISTLADIIRVRHNINVDKL